VPYLGAGERIVGTFAPRARELVRNCKRDEGRSFEVGMQVRASNHPKRLWPKAMVVSVGEKAHVKCQMWAKKVSDKRTIVGVENVHRRCQNWGPGSTPGRAQQIPAYRLSGIRRTGGTSLVRALLRNVGTLHAMPRENPISVNHEGGKYRCA